MTNQTGDTEMADEGPDKSHNLTAINSSIQDTFAKLFEKDQQITRAMESHVDHLKGDRKLLLKDLKSDSDIDGKDLTLMYKLYARQEMAKTMDEDDRSRILDNLKITFEALAKNGQLDFIDAAELVSRPTQAAP